MRHAGNETLATLTAYKSGFFNIGLFSAVINLLMLAPALYMLQVYDRVLASGNEMTLLMLTLMILGLFGLMGALEWVRSQVVIRLGTQMDMRLNQRVYDAAFEAQLKGGTQAAGQALHDLTTLRQFATGQALFAFFDAPWFPVYLLVIFLFHPWLGVLALVGALLLIVLAWVNHHVSQAPMALASQLSISASQQATANLRNADTIEAMGMLATLRARWFGQHQAFLAQQNLASEKTATVTAWSKGVRLALQSLVLGLGALLAVQGEITPGMMIAGSILMGRVLSPIDQLIGVWKQWGSARLAFDRLSQMLAANPARPQRMALPVPKGQLSVEQISACAPGSRRPALANLGFNLAAGEVLGVIGPSGCGKSTLLRVFNRMFELYPEQRAEGEILLDGENLLTSKKDVALLRAKVGMVFQKPTPFPMSIFDNIAFGVKLFENLNMTDLEERVEWALRKAALWGEVKDKLQQNGASLSGGQQQRLCIARGIAIRPEVLLLDEPCSALDPISTAKIEELITELKKDYTVVIVTHNMQQAARCSDYTAYMYLGDLMEFGSTEQMFFKPGRKETEDYITGRFG